MRQRPRVLIVDDHPLFRDALSSALLTAFPDGAEAVQADTLGAAVAIVEEQPADLVMLDLKLPDTEGFDGLARLQSISENSRFVIVSATESDDVVGKAKSLGAQGYVPKSLPLEELCGALVTVLDGGTWFPDTTHAAESEQDDLAKRVVSLTPAQRRVLSGLADGLLNKQIAYEMDISIATVKAHMTAIFRKLGANNRTQALLIYKSAVALGDEASTE